MWFNQRDYEVRLNEEEIGYLKMWECELKEKIDGEENVKMK